MGVLHLSLLWENPLHHPASTGNAMPLEVSQRAMPATQGKDQGDDTFPQGPHPRPCLGPPGTSQREQTGWCVEDGGAERASAQPHPVRLSWARSPHITTSSKPTVTVRHVVSTLRETEWRLPTFYYLEEKKKKRCVIDKLHDYVTYRIVQRSALRKLVSVRLSTMTRNIRQTCDQGTLVTRAGGELQGLREGEPGSLISCGSLSSPPLLLFLHPSLLGTPRPKYPLNHSPPTPASFFLRALAPPGRTIYISCSSSCCLSPTEKVNFLR